jgi:hypothetical protein
MTENTTVQRAGLAAFALTAAVLIPLNFAGSGEDGGTGAYIVCVAVCAALVLALFRWAIPRAVAAGPAAAGRRALGLSIAAVLTVAAFWSGLPLVLGGAAATMGALARERGAGRTATVAIVLGCLAMVLFVAVAAFDQLS